MLYVVKASRTDEDRRRYSDVLYTLDEDKAERLVNEIESDRYNHQTAFCDVVVLDREYLL